jgi:hypothetical protein
MFLKSLRAHKNVPNLLATRKVLRTFQKYALIDLSFRAHFKHATKSFKDTSKMWPENL